ncbi:hypothetical protein N7468_009681 [Penicillium chermesinum]|uniref:Uncharacterized protein n=1 Tax=Penicillium chermesinum TaxID=63820 RepID=A0A9W9NIE1_9EURO|nr:uncharacterized protein N7468_009681 [Penicillium chermesinum]KAJ5220477.1 hypothetical protein N7468_009681 [Penicillium chermesinum]
MHKLAEDGSSYLGIQEGKEGMVDFLDTMFQELRGRCGSAFEEAQLEGCQDSLQAKNAIKCAEDNSRTAKMHALKFLLPYITADRCKKVGEYFESTQLWETSFPKHAQNQVNSCNEL